MIALMSRLVAFLSYQILGLLVTFYVIRILAARIGCLQLKINCMVKQMDLSRQTWVQDDVLPLSRCVTLGKLLDLCNPVFSSVKWV